jgi:DNA sulfur modification protein DndD
MIRAEYGSAGDQLKRILRDVTRLKETVSGKARELQDARTRREGIDQERVAVVTERLRKLRADELRTSEAIGRLQLEVENLSVAVTEWEDRFQEVERRASSAVTVRARNNAASDLLSLTSRILAVLKNEWIGRVSTKMNELFLEIVGADPDHVGGVFRRVYISEKFDIVVESADGRTLDFDQEVNGASQRALTLSFIWALMEVTGREAPRVIDTPLGMVSGGVRTRMVELITQSGPTNRQVVLLMTRAEIRDVEQLLEERMGVALTLSCSKDYPTDLITNWASDNPEVRRCDCNHRQFCAVCARKGDAHFGLQERGAV